ncbi:hypothetical protein MTO96_031777 [Rhipicephalus appendiculatus]
MEETSFVSDFSSTSEPGSLIVSTEGDQSDREDRETMLGVIFCCCLVAMVILVFTPVNYQKPCNDVYYSSDKGYNNHAEADYHTNHREEDYEKNHGEEDYDKNHDEIDYDKNHGEEDHKKNHGEEDYDTNHDEIDYDKNHGEEDHDKNHGEED